MRYTYTVRVVALGGAVLGMISAVLGCFAVLRRESLMGDVLSHAALPGVATAFLLAGRELSLLLAGAGIASWLALRFVAAVLRTTRIKQDTAMGIALATWFAAGIALLTYIQSIPDASQAGLDNFIFGQAAAIIESDVVLASAVGVAVLTVLLLFWKEFKLVTFDPEFASVNGFRVGFINTLLSTLIVAAIVLGLQLAGVILMVGILIAPAISARQWTHKLGQMVMLSAVFGAFSGGVGAVISAIDSDIPTGPMIIIVAFALVILSIAFAPGRGLVWSGWRQRADSRRFAKQNALRDIYKYAMSHGGGRFAGAGCFHSRDSQSQRLAGLESAAAGWACRLSGRFLAAHPNRHPAGAQAGRTARPMMTLERLWIELLLHFASRDELNLFLRSPQNTATVVGCLIAISGALLGTFLLFARHVPDQRRHQPYGAAGHCGRFFADDRCLWLGRRYFLALAHHWRIAGWGGDRRLDGTALSLWFGAPGCGAGLGFSTAVRHRGHPDRALCRRCPSG